MSLALYLSRVRSSELSGRRLPECQPITVRESNLKLLLAPRLNSDRFHALSRQPLQSFAKLSIKIIHIVNVDIDGYTRLHFGRM